jgi:2-polyprenyl-3-methyl-5-hydroxy-6-metoxy-1,4-benzoquinol methylase
MSSKEILFYPNPDVMLHNLDGIWYASNPRLRTHIVVDAATLAALGSGTAGLSEADWTSALAAASGYDRSQRGLGAEGLHTDHSGVAREAGPNVSGESLVRLLRKRRVLIASTDEAFDLVRPLSSPFDMESTGNFHQRVGQLLLLQRQREPWRAWQNQKFTEDGLALRQGTYLRIQAPFFEQYFTQQRMEGKRVLDFGCGNGYFSARMASRGATVLAMDNSTELLEIARRNHGQLNGLKLIETSDFDQVIELCAAELPSSFDYITLQDTLLLLLQPESGKPLLQLPEVLRAFRRLLKPGGILCAMEPNTSFWLASRFGHPERPYAVVSEYFTRRFHVAPTLEVVLSFMAEAGFALAGYKHPRPDNGTKPDADLAYQREFPIWDFFEFVLIAQELA